MKPRHFAVPVAAALLAALGCTRTQRLADWTGDPDAGSDVIAMDCGSCTATGVDIQDLRCAIDLCDPAVVLNGDGEYSTRTHYSKGMAPSCELADTREAIAQFGNLSNDLAPKLNGSYAILATGDWDAVIHNTSCAEAEEEDDLADAGVADDYGGGGAMYDAVEWKLELRAPADARSFSFDYVFFSTEYDEGISSTFNDRFYVLLEATSTHGGAPTVINTTACRDPETYFDFEVAGVKYCYVAINSALSECCWRDDCPDGVAETSIAGTGFECGTSQADDGSTHGSSTGWLRTEWPIDPGEVFTLTFHIHDTNDSGWDSAVVIDAFQFHTSSTSGGTIVVQ